MPDVQLDYQVVHSVASVLDSQGPDIINQLNDLKTKVDGLVSTPEGGLWFKATSPAIQNVYTDFNTKITDACNTITQFSGMFHKIATDMDTNDTTMAEQILHPPAA